MYFMTQIANIALIFFVKTNRRALHMTSLKKFSRLLKLFLPDQIMKLDTLSYHSSLYERCTQKCHGYAIFFMLDDIHQYSRENTKRRKFT